MSSKIITTVIVALVVGPFSCIAITDAVNIKHNLQEQTTHIKKLNTEYVRLDKELKQTKDVKESAAKEVEQLQQEILSASSEITKLEAELGAN